jgi:hypothetical protein
MFRLMWRVTNMLWDMLRPTWVGTNMFRNMFRNELPLRGWRLRRRRRQAVPSRKHVLDLGLPTVRSPLDQLLDGLGSEVRGKQANSRQVKPSLGQGREEDRIVTRRPGGLDPLAGFILGEMQLVDAVDEHGGVSGGCVELAGIDLGNVG